MIIGSLVLLMVLLLTFSVYSSACRGEKQEYVIIGIVPSMPKTTISMRSLFVAGPLLWQKMLNIIISTFPASSVKLTYAPTYECPRTPNGLDSLGPQNGFTAVVSGSPESVQKTLKTFQKSIPDKLGKIFTSADEELLVRMKALCKELQQVNDYDIDLYGISLPEKFIRMHTMLWHYIYEDYKDVFDKHGFSGGYKNLCLQSLRQRLSDDMVQYYKMMNDIACLLRESTLIVEHDEPRTLADLVDNSDGIRVIVNNKEYNELKAKELFQECRQSGQSGQSGHSP